MPDTTSFSASSHAELDALIEQKKKEGFKLKHREYKWNQPDAHQYVAHFEPVVSIDDRLKAAETERDAARSEAADLRREVEEIKRRGRSAVTADSSTAPTDGNTANKPEQTSLNTKPLTLPEANK